MNGVSSKSMAFEATTITLNDRIELINQVGNMLLDQITNRIGELSNEKFLDSIIEECKKILIIQLGHLYNYDIEDDVNLIINEAMLIINETFVPKRAYKTTFAIKKVDTDKISKIIDTLRKKPQPEQRTAEWYQFRHNLLTASNAWKAFHTESSKNQLIYEKCEPINCDKFSSVNTDTPFHWGQKYEEVSVMLYEYIYETKLEDFGCIKDDNYAFLGVSPDGINVDINSPRYGRMVEIKNPTTRIINGIPKRDYWIQMQL